MKVFKVDAYKYDYEKGLRFTNSKGSVQLNKGTIFYYATTDHKGDYISLLPKGPFFKLSEESFNKLSDRSKEVLMNAHVDIVKPSDDAQRSYEYPVDYYNILKKNKVYIFTELEKLFRTFLPKNALIKKFNSLTVESSFGELGVISTYEEVEHRLTFHLGNNPFFAYTTWYPKPMKAPKLDLDTKMSKRLIWGVQQTVFKKLMLKQNDIKPRRSIVNLPARHFDGTILGWYTKI
jgi:hypothetical protein